MRQWFTPDDVIKREKEGYKEVSCEDLGVPKLAGMALMEKPEAKAPASEVKKGKGKK